MHLKKLKKKWIEQGNYVPRIKINDCIFYREPNISQEEIGYPDGWRKGDWKQEDFIRDIEQDLIDNPAPDHIPKYQTHAQMYQRMKGRKHWDDLFYKIKHSLLRYYTKEYTLFKSWANVSRENSEFSGHTHPCDLTVVYYLKCDLPEYGTFIMNEGVMMPAVNDSILIFNPEIEHLLTNMPYELAVHPQYHRYSIVFDFKIDKSKTT